MTNPEPVLTTVRIVVTINDPAATRYEVARTLDIVTDEPPAPGTILRAITQLSSQITTVLRHRAPEPEETNSDLRQ